MFKFMIEEDGQEDRNADVGDAGAVPVDFGTGKGRVVLTGRDDDTHDQRQEGGLKGNQVCFIRQVFQILAWGDIGPAEAVVQMAMPIQVMKPAMPLMLTSQS